MPRGSRCSFAMFRDRGAAILAVATLPALAAAQVTYTSQTRTVSAFYGGTGAADPSSSDSRSAPDFGPFMGNASASGLSGGGSASQTSTLNPNGIRASGSAQGAHINAFPASGLSDMDIFFSIANPTPYTLTGGWFNPPRATTR